MLRSWMFSCVFSCNSFYILLLKEAGEGRHKALPLQLSVGSPQRVGTRHYPYVDGQVAGRGYSKTLTKN